MYEGISALLNVFSLVKSSQLPVFTNDYIKRKGYDRNEYNKDDIITL